MKRTGKRKQEWRVGDVFLVPVLGSEQACVAQVVGKEPDAMNSATIVLFDELVDGAATSHAGPLQRERIYSSVFVTRDLLDSGRWRVIASAPAAIEPAERPFEKLRATGFIGAKIRGSGLVESFVSAFYGFAAWDHWANPEYLDGFLVSPDKKPLQRLIFKS